MGPLVPGQEAYWQQLAEADCVWFAGGAACCGAEVLFPMNEKKPNIGTQPEDLATGNIEGGDMIHD